MAKICMSVFVLLVAISVIHAKNLKGKQQEDDSKQFVVINGSEYYIHTETWLNFEAAKKDCENRGSRLITFSTREKYDELILWLKENYMTWQWFWTGGQRAAGSNEWRWSTSNERIINFMWAPNRPSNQDTSQTRCITFSYDFPGWDDDSCSQTVLPHICEKC